MFDKSTKILTVVLIFLVGMVIYHWLSKEAKYETHHNLYEVVTFSGEVVQISYHNSIDTTYDGYFIWYPYQSSGESKDKRLMKFDEVKLIRVLKESSRMGTKKGKLNYTYNHGR